MFLNGNGQTEDSVPVIESIPWKTYEVITWKRSDKLFLAENLSLKVRGIFCFLFFIFFPAFCNIMLGT